MAWEALSSIRRLPLGVLPFWDGLSSLHLAPAHPCGAENNVRVALQAATTYLWSCGAYRIEICMYI